MKTYLREHCACRATLLSLLGNQELPECVQVVVLFLHDGLVMRPAVIHRNGLDYLVAEAKNYGIRLLLSLTNGDTGFGGMEQYVKWARGGRKGGSITDFYNSKELRVCSQASMCCQWSHRCCVQA
jgi:hypothetical protein